MEALHNRLIVADARAQLFLDRQQGGGAGGGSGPPSPSGLLANVRARQGTCPGCLARRDASASATTRDPSAQCRHHNCLPPRLGSLQGSLALFFLAYISINEKYE